MAFRGNVLSAVLASATVFAVFWAGLRIGRRVRPDAPLWLAVASAALGAATLGAAPLFWSLAVLTEVYTLNSLLAAALVLLATHIAWDAGPKERWSPALFGLVLGLGLGNHLTLLAVAAPLGLWIWSVVGLRRALNPWAAAALLVGLSVYIYLPLRAAQVPPVNWGDADTLSGFAWMLTGGPYQEYLLGVPARSIVSRLVPFGELVFSQFNPLGLFFGLVGARALLTGAPRLLAAMASSLVVLTAYALTYNTVDYEVLFVPVFLLFALLVGVGFMWIAASWSEGVGHRESFALGTLRFNYHSTFLAAALLAFALVPGVSVALNYAAQDLSGNRSAYDHGEALLKSLPSGTVVLANSETTAFPLWYMRYVERTDLDLAVVAVPLLQFDWYRRELRQHSPGLVPEIETLDLNAAIEAIVVNNAEKGAYFTFNPDSVSKSFSAERQGLVWHVTAPAP